MGSHSYAGPLGKWPASATSRSLQDLVDAPPCETIALTAEANPIREDGFRAGRWGITGYARSETPTLDGWAEGWRNNANLFVTTPVAALGCSAGHVVVGF